MLCKVVACERPLHSRQRKRWNEKNMFPVHMELLAAGHDDSEQRAGIQQFLKTRGCTHHLLKIIEEQEEMFALESVLHLLEQIGRASCRERVQISVVAVSL